MVVDCGADRLVEEMIWRASSLNYDRKANDERERAREVAGGDEFTKPNFTRRQRPNTRSGANTLTI